jgi:pimeloyl-ACP methyl ester carboxylesterase
MKKKTKMPASLKIIRTLFGLFGGLFPTTAGSIAKSLWVKTKRFTPPAVEKKAASEALISVTRVGDVDVTTYEWGEPDRPAILFVHGWNGRGTQCAGMLDTLQQAGFRIVSFDALGHGRTAGNQTNILEISQTIVAICTKHGPFQAMLTHSFGGPCAAVALTSKALDVKQLVCIAPPSRTDGLIDFFSPAINLPKRATLALKHSVEDEFGTDVWQRTSMRENVKQLTMPALVIHDKDDKEVPWTEGQAVASAWPGAELVLTHSLGHRRILNADICSTTIIPFLESA